MKKINKKQLKKFEQKIINDPKSLDFINATLDAIKVIDSKIEEAKNKKDKE